MRDDLLHYYERELSFLRRMGAEFAERYPKVAGRLQLEPNKCEDPHVERLLEAFAFLAARVHLKVDDDFPEIIESLLGVVYPHYVRPLPSMSLVEFHVDPDQGKLTTGVRIPRDTELYSRPVGGVACRFRTCYDTTLWPITVGAAQWTTPDRLGVRTDAVAALRVELRCLPDVTFRSLDLSSLRFHLQGESSITFALHEVLLNSCSGVIVRELAATGAAGSARPPAALTLRPDVVRQVGFAADEGMLPYPRRSFLGYRLLQEYFAFPEKFLFLDVGGFDRVREAGFGERVELIFLIAPFERAERRAVLEAGVSERTLRLGCAPIVNLFPQTSEPVLVTQKRHEYEVVPDARRRHTTEVFSVDQVVGVRPGSSDPLHFEPLYSHRHASEAPRGERIFWHANRRPSGWRVDGGTDLYLAFADLSGRTVRPTTDVVTARLTCFNGTLPGRLPFGSESSDFDMEGGGPVRRIVALVKPTPVVEPPLGRPLLWRLVSQLSLNYLSLVDEGVDALREILTLHNFSGAPAGERQILGLLGVRSEPGFARVASDHGISFARGRRVEVELDEEHFAGGSAFLFASVLDRFLGLYVSMNSFSSLVARSRQRNRPLAQWSPRSGWKTLL